MIESEEGDQSPEEVRAEIEEHKDMLNKEQIIQRRVSILNDPQADWYSRWCAMNEHKMQRPIYTIFQPKRMPVILSIIVLILSALMGHSWIGLIVLLFRGYIFKPVISRYTSRKIGEKRTFWGLAVFNVYEDIYGDRYSGSSQWDIWRMKE